FQESEQSKEPAPTTQLKLDMVAGSIGNDDDRAALSEEELQAEQDAQIEKASAAGLGSFENQRSRELFTQEQELLQKMADIADDARARPDARVAKLIEWIRRQMCPDLGKPEAHRNEIRVIIFTEFYDTK